MLLILNAARRIKKLLGEDLIRYFKNTVLLLNGEDNNTSGQGTFVDLSGNVPSFSFTGTPLNRNYDLYNDSYGAYFNGAANSYLSFPSNSAYHIGTQDASVEVFCQITAYPSNYAGLFGQNSGAGCTLRIGVASAGNFYCHANSDSGHIGDSSKAEIGRWYHVLVTFSASQQRVRFFVDGVLIASQPVTSIVQRNEDYIIGGEGVAEGNFTGALSNFRFCKGGIPVEYQTSSITNGEKIFEVPKEKLTATAHTVLLALTEAYIRDEKSSNITIAGTAATTIRGPFIEPDKYQTGCVSTTSSVLYNETSNVVDFGTGAFTVETWVYFNSLTTGANLFNVFLASNPITGGFQIYKGDTTNDVFYGATSLTRKLIIPAAQLVSNRWYHIAVVREHTGTNGTRVYVNGRLSGTYTDNSSYDMPGIFLGGYKNSLYFPGYIGPTRVVKGTALYTANFTPSMPTNVSGTSLLLNFDQMGINDKSFYKHIINKTWGTKVSNFSKYGNRSLEFNGVDSRIDLAYTTNHQFGNSNFTIEFWLYQKARNTTASILNCGGGLNIAWPSYGILITPDGYLRFVASLNNAGYQVGGDGTTNSDSNGGNLGLINLNQWYHVAVVREGNVYRGYLNGNQTWTQTVAGSLYDSTPRGLMLGATVEYTWGSAPTVPLNGYIDDLRISKGVALYTGNSFTPPSALM